MDKDTQKKQRNLCLEWTFYSTGLWKMHVHGSEELGAAGSWEPWAAPDENIGCLTIHLTLQSGTVSHCHSQTSRVSIIPFGRVKALLKAGIVIIASAVPILGECT